MLSSQEQHILIYNHLNVCSVILPKDPNPSYGLIGLKKSYVHADPKKYELFFWFQNIQIGESIVEVLLQQFCTITLVVVTTILFDTYWCLLCTLPLSSVNV